MKKKRYLVAKSVMAAAVATSVYAVANPTEAASISTAEKAVAKAEKLAGALKWEVSIEYRKTTYPNSLVGYPNMKLHNDTKNALAAARNAVASLKGKDKDILSARLDANVAKYVNRSVAYIDAVSSGLKIQKKYNELHAKYVKGEVDDQTEKLYHQLSYEIKKNAYMLDRVYGETTRAEFRTFYKGTAEKQLADLLYPVTVKIEIDRANTAVKNNDLTTAAKRLGNVDFFVTEAAKKGLKENSKLIVSAKAKLSAAQAEFNKKGVLYVAKSTDAAAPTTFGPATGSESTTKTVVVYVGKDAQLKLQNVSIDSNLVIVGSPAGAGTVYLENVKVNKVNSTSGSIIVEDIADHSLHMKGVQADSLLVNDPDGSNIVAEKGTKLNHLVLSEKSGAKGKATLESQEKGSIGDITVASKGTSSSQGIELKGDLSNTGVSVTGEGNKLSVAKGATVGSLNFKAPGSLDVAEGSTVKEVKKDASVKGDVKVENKGTVEKADSNVAVGGNKPGEVTNPTKTPSTGGGGGGITPTLSSFAAELSIGEVTGINGRVDLGSSIAPDNAVFTGVKINAANASKFKVTSLTARGSSTNWIDTPVEYNLSGNTTTITTKNLFGSFDTGTDGISMTNLRAVFLDQDITLTGKLIDSNGVAGSEISIKINLGNSTVPVTTFTNDFGTITKKGLNGSHHELEVVINPTKYSTKIGEIQNANAGISFAQLLISFAASNVLFSPDVIPSNASELSDAISDRLLAGLLSDVTLGELCLNGAGRTFTTDDFIVVIK